MALRRHVAVVLIAVPGAVAIAACGSASTYSTSGSSGPSPNVTHAFLAFARCMRADGVSNFPDPTGGGGIQLPAGVNPASPAFKSARSKCRHLLPGGGPPTGPPSAKAKLAALQTSECMRRHGVTGFPDPTDRPPSNPNGYSEIDDRGGVVLAVPNTIDVQSPVYQAAAKACAFG
jgi:hypothetical protein